MLAGMEHKIGTGGIAEEEDKNCERTTHAKEGQSRGGRKQRRYRSGGLDIWYVALRGDSQGRKSLVGITQRFALNAFVMGLFFGIFARILRVIWTWAMTSALPTPLRTPMAIPSRDGLGLGHEGTSPE